MDRAGSQKLCAIELFKRIQIALRVRVGADSRKNSAHLILGADMCNVEGSCKAKIVPHTVEQYRDQLGWAGPTAVAADVDQQCPRVLEFLHLSNRRLLLGRIFEGLDADI